VIRVCAVTADKLVCRFIRWGLGEAASHLALIFDGQVIHSTLAGGVHAEETAPFLETYRVVDSVDLVGASEAEQLCVYRNTLLLFEGAPYDVEGFIGFAAAAAGKKFLGRKPPPFNPGDDQKAFLCVEVLYGFLDVWAMIKGQSITLTTDTLGIMTPLACIRWLREALLANPLPRPPSPHH
jgi:hypothetical protein